MWEIIDDNGTVHSGSEEEMRIAFATMIEEEEATNEQKMLYSIDWIGDLKLIQIHNTYR